MSEMAQRIPAYLNDVLSEGVYIFMAQAQSLRTLLSQDQFLMAAGAYDVISARLVEEAGFPLVYYSGGVSAGAR